MRSVLSWPTGWEQLTLANHQLLRCWVPLFFPKPITPAQLFFSWAECFYWRDTVWLLCQQLLSFKPGWITLPYSQPNSLLSESCLSSHLSSLALRTGWQAYRWARGALNNAPLSSGSLHIPLGRETPLTPQRCVSAKISTYRNHIKRGAGNWGFLWQKLQHQLHRSARGLLVPLWASSCPCSTSLLFRPPAWPYQPYWLQMHPQFPARASRDLHTHLPFCESLFCVTAKRLSDQRSCPEARAAVTELLQQNPIGQNH